METLKKQNCTEISWLTNVYNSEFSVKTPLEHGIAIEYTFFPMIITVCTLLSILQLIKHFKRHVVNQGKPTLFS